MANARMPEEFFDTVAQNHPLEQPVGPKGGHLVSGTGSSSRWIEFVLATGARWEYVPNDSVMLGFVKHEKNNHLYNNRYVHRSDVVFLLP